jgi:hypothetical protein
MILWNRIGGGYLLLASISAGFEPTVVDSFRRYDDILPVRCGLFIDKSRAEVENQRVSGFSDAVPSSLLGSRFGASPRAPAACGAFAEGAWDKVPKT